MKTRTLLSSMTLAIASSSCAVSIGPPDDGVELSQESADIGYFFGEDFLTLEVDEETLKRNKDKDKDKEIE